MIGGEPLSGGTNAVADPAAEIRRSCVPTYELPGPRRARLSVMFQMHPDAASDWMPTWRPQFDVSTLALSVLVVGYHPNRQGYENDEAWCFQNLS